MNFKIKDKDLKLNFGVRFTAQLDESEQYKTEGIEFGMGLMLAKQKLSMGKFDALASIIEHALYREGVTSDEVYDALDEYGEENDLEELFKKIEEELKNSNAVRTALTRMEKTNTEAKRKKAASVAALKPTKK